MTNKEWKKVLDFIKNLEAVELLEEIESEYPETSYEMLEGGIFSKDEKENFGAELVNEKWRRGLEKVGYCIDDNGDRYLVFDADLEEKFNAKFEELKRNGFVNFYKFKEAYLFELWCNEKNIDITVRKEKRVKIVELVIEEETVETKEELTEEKEDSEEDGMEKIIEMLEEMGYYVMGDGNILEELQELEKAGYNCYYDRNRDRIVWEDYKEEI